jgi:hypothetical protein
LDLAHPETEELVDAASEGVSVRCAPVEVDPEELALAEALDDVGRQVDRAIVAVRVEEECRRAAQWTRLSRPAARTATMATAYWIASMMRSAPGSSS